MTWMNACAEKRWKKLIISRMANGLRKWRRQFIKIAANNVFRDYKRSAWHGNAHFFVFYYLLSPRLPLLRPPTATESIGASCFFDSHSVVSPNGSWWQQRAASSQQSTACANRNRRKFTFFGNVIYSWFYRLNLETAWSWARFAV